jgi:predicted nucleotidyltransferase
MSLQCYVIQKRSQYCLDLERALSEATLTSELLTIVENGINTKEKKYEPEELIIYYNGVFLEFIHTIKDKLLRLIWWMIQDENAPLKEPGTIRIINFKKFKSKLEDIDIFTLLGEWNQDCSDSVISVCLRKRTHHHHFISNLRHNPDFQNIQLSKIMLAPESINTLSEYGKNEMQKLGEESYKKWRGNLTNKQLETLKLVKENIESISSKLIEYYKVPIDPVEQAKIINEYLELGKKFKIKNETSIKNIPTNFMDEIKLLISEFEQLQEFKIISIYLVGSVPRGEFLPGTSDINLIIITDSKTRMDLKSIPLDIHFLSEEEFISDQNKKYRFISKYDGLLIKGKEFKIDEKEFPKPGLFLAIQLNKEFIEKLENIKNYIVGLNNPTTEILRFNSLKAIRIMIDFLFGVAISNEPFYTSSRM